MAKAVKGTRPYDSPRRREQAAATRREILDAAQRLFEQQGYAATTMAAVAAEARVALKTVYIAFETKSGLLRALWHLLLRGDEDESPVGRARLVPRGPRGARPRAPAAPQRAQREDGQAAHRAAHRGHPQRGLRRPRHRGALEPHPGDFYDNQRAIVERLHQRKALRRGLDVTRAADILWTLNHPNVWQLLVVERGWTPDRFEKWFADTAVAQLLR